MPTLRLLPLLACLACTAAGAGPQRIQSPAHRVTLLELFTSEGCSSCPPADLWMSGLKDDPRLWTAVVPVAFHVDYWDYIGWPDRFADPAFGARQREHARAGGLGSVYTPGFVVHGEEWRGWFRRPVLELQDPPPAGVITLDVDPAAARVAASYVAARPGTQQLDLHLAVLGFDLATEVKAGENDGRQLRHDFVVLGYAHTALTGQGARFEASTALPAATVPAGRRALAAWVSARGQPRPLQAAGGWLVD